MKDFEDSLKEIKEGASNALDDFNQNKKDLMDRIINKELNFEDRLSKKEDLISEF